MIRHKIIVLAAASLLATSAYANPEKLAKYQTMRQLAAEIETLKQGNAVDNASRIQELQVQFKDLQQSMGGDDPTRMYETVSRGASPAVRGSGATPPTPPAGMTVTTTSVSSTTVPVAIPTGPAVVTDTITVSGAQTYLWDIDLDTLIDHTFSADLDITIQSPAGTIVTLTTDNGAGNDNVFNGTVWDDDANPAGQVPYTTNNGMVTDNAYANLTVASPLAPEEGLGAFRGEDPNGVWTLTISDDLAGDGGNLTGWVVTLHTLNAAPSTTSTVFANTTPVAVPTGPGVVTQTVAVSGLTGVITDATLTTNLTHTFAADIDATLQSPAGTVVTLSTDNGAGNDNVFNGTLWDVNGNPAGQVPYTTNNGLTTDNTYANLTTATPLASEESMSAFVGEDPNGTWTLTVSDDLAGDGGSLDSFALNITTGVAPCLAIICPANIDIGTDTGVCNTLVNYPAPTGDPGCGTITCTQASGTTFNLGSTAVNCTSQAGPACSFNVNVTDDEPPAIVCPATITTAATSALGTAVTFAAPTATDNCAAPTVVCAPASGSTFPIGASTDTCTATDAATLSANCSFDINVVATDLSITKTSSTPGALNVGDSALFTLTVSNPATVDATGVVVTDNLPSNLSFVSSNCGATAVGQTVTWNVGTLAASGSQSCALTTAVTIAGPVTNSADVSATTFDPNPANNAANVRILGALVTIPVLSSVGLFALIGLLLGIVWARRQTI